MGYGMVIVAIDNKHHAEKLADFLLEKRLAGCIQILPIESHYLWKGKKEEASEILLLIKTHRRYYKAIEKVVIANHPYEIPEIVFVPLTMMFSGYRKWLKKVMEEKK